MKIKQHYHVFIAMANFILPFPTDGSM